MAGPEMHTITIYLARRGPGDVRHFPRTSEHTAGTKLVNVAHI